MRDWLIHNLRVRGLTVCVDYESFRFGESLIEEMTRAVTSSRFTVLVYSDSFLQSDWTRFERIFSGYLAAKNSGHKAIPLLYEKVEIPQPFDMFIAADFTQEEDRDYQLEKLVNQVRSKEATALRTVNVPAVRSRYHNFNVMLSPCGPGRLELRASCPHVEQRATSFVPTPAADTWRLANDLKAAASDRSVAQQVGNALFRTIFPAEVSELWSKAQGLSDTRGALRLRLKIADPRLSALPWELLHNGQFFLAMARHYPIVRYSADLASGQPAVVKSKINVLVADTTCGDGASSSDVDRHIECINSRLQEPLANGRIGDLRVLPKASLTQLQSTLRTGKFEIVHILGHGEFKGDVGRLLLRGNEGETRGVDGEMFAIFLRESPVRLLILSGCEAGTASPMEPLLSVARGVHGLGVPAVVAMQGGLSGRATRAFSDTFYEVLAEGCPVEMCVAEGRKSILAAEGLDSPQWAFPVLFNDDPDVLMFRPKPAPHCFGVEVRRFLPEEAAAAPEAAPEPSGSVSSSADAPVRPAGTRVANNLESILEPTGDLDRPLVGRDTESRRVWEALSSDSPNNVILLKGPPGVGKTSIAWRVASRAANPGSVPSPGRRAFDSVIWVSTSDAQATGLEDIAFTTPRRVTLSGITAVVLTALNQRQLIGLDLPARVKGLADTMGFGSHLILIDDVSFLHQEAVAEFIRSMPRMVRFLITAEHRLGVGELEVEIGQLGPDDAARLAAQTARRDSTAVGDTAGVTGGGAPAVGIPFIIKAESFPEGLPPPPPLGGEDSSADGASRVTVQDYLDRRIPDLPEDCRSVLEVCGALPYPANRAVVRLASGLGEPRFEPAVHVLLGKGLLESPRDGVLGLSGTLRSLAWGDRPIPAHGTELTVRCITALRDFLDGNPPPSDGAARAAYVAIIDRELGNLAWGMQGAYATGRLDFLQRFREVLDDPLYRLGHWRLALAMGDLAYLAGSRLRNHVEMAWAALYPMARVHYHLGNYRGAERWCATSLAIFQDLDHHYGIFAAQRYLGRVMQSLGDYARARELFSDALKRAQQRPEDHNAIGLALASLGALEQIEGRPEEARRLYSDALAHYELTGKAESIGPTLHALGRLAFDANDIPTAMGLFIRALDLSGQGLWKNRQARIAFSIGLAYERQDDLTRAMREFQKAREIFAELRASAELAEVDAAIVRVSALEKR